MVHSKSLSNDQVDLMLLLAFCPSRSGKGEAGLSFGWMTRAAQFANPADLQNYSVWAS